MGTNTRAIGKAASGERRLSLTARELDALKWLLVDERQRIVDAMGFDGAFDQSPLAIALRKVKAAER